MGYIDDLCSYVENGYHVGKNRDAMYGEADYAEYINGIIQIMNLRAGDLIHVVYKLVNSNQKKEVTGMFLEYVGRMGKGSYINPAFMDSYYLHMLSAGKKVWKSKDNLHNIDNRTILSIERIQDASDQFDPASTGYTFCKDIRKRQDDVYQNEIDKRETSRKMNERQTVLMPYLQEQFHLSSETVTAGVWLFLNVHLYWDYVEEIENVSIYITYKNSSKVTALKSLKITTPYPNEYWHVVNSNYAKNESVLGTDLWETLPVYYKNKEELDQIDKICVCWECAPKYPYVLISVVRPKFIQSQDSNKNIYNVVMRDYSLQTMAAYLTNATNCTIPNELRYKYKMACMVRTEKDDYVLIKNDYTSDFCQRVITETLLVFDKDHSITNKSSVEFLVYNKEITGSLLPDIYEY